MPQCKPGCEVEISDDPHSNEINGDNNHLDDSDDDSIITEIRNDWLTPNEETYLKLRKQQPSQLNNQFNI